MTYSALQRKLASKLETDLFPYGPLFFNNNSILFMQNKNTGIITPIKWTEIALQAKLLTEIQMYVEYKCWI